MSQEDLKSTSALSQVSDRKWQVSTGGGSDPKWRRDGKELFYLSPAGKFMAVALRGDTNFEAGTPKALFETRLAEAQLCSGYAVTNDGQRFLMPIEEATFVPFTVVINWTAELKR